MLTKTQIKLIRSLEHKKYRTKHNLFVAEGTKVVKEFINNNWTPYLIISTEQWAKENPEVKNLITCHKQEIEKISLFKTPSDVVGVFYQKEEGFFKDIENCLVFALDKVQDAGNVGTIIRIALWFGFDSVVLGEGCADLYNPKVVQASMGAIAKISCTHKQLDIFLKENLKKTTIYGTFLEGESIYNTKLSNHGIVVLGNESKGISSTIKPYIHKKIFIPSFYNQKPIDSLNVATSAAIIGYEFRRVKS